MTKSNGVEMQRQLHSQIKVSILLHVNFLLTSIEQETGFPGLHVDYLSESFSLQFNGLSLNSSVHIMLEGKDCPAMNMVFSIIRAYVDRITGFQKDANMTIVRRMYPDIASKVVLQIIAESGLLQKWKLLQRHL